MATFVKIDERAALVIVAVVGIGLAFYLAPDATMTAIEGVSESIAGVMP